MTRSDVTQSLESPRDLSGTGRGTLGPGPIPDTTHKTHTGTQVLSQTQGWCQGGQWGGIDSSPMECLGMGPWSSDLVLRPFSAVPSTSVERGFRS